MVKRGQRHMNYRYDAISPVDGRYYNETKEVRNYFSEPALIRARVHVEREYLRFLVRSGIAPDVDLPEFDVSVKRVKQIEKRVRHDVKEAEAEGLRSFGSYKRGCQQHSICTDLEEISSRNTHSSVQKDDILPCRYR